MKIRQCSQCKAIFQPYGGEVICARCMELMDEQFVKVRDYLYEHPRSGIMELSKQTKVEETMILRFLKEQRLFLSEPTDYLRCTVCNKAITKGTYCDQCKISIQSELVRILPDSNAQSKKRRNLGYAQIIQYDDENE